MLAEVLLCVQKPYPCLLEKSWRFRGGKPQITDYCVSFTDSQADRFPLFLSAVSSEEGDATDLVPMQLWCSMYSTELFRSTQRLGLHCKGRKIPEAIVEGDLHDACMIPDWQRLASRRLLRAGKMTASAGMPVNYVPWLRLLHI